MDHGADTDAVPVPPAGDEAAEHAAPGRIPLAVVVVDREGLVSHWSRGARRLFGTARQDAVGRPAVDLLPVSGALPESGGRDAYVAHDGLGPDLEASLDGRLSYPAAGRARLFVPEGGRSATGTRPGVGWDRADVLWWAYPLVGPGPERLLVLAADADALHQEGGAAVESIAPGFALHTDFPGAEELARRLPEIMPSMSVGESARIVAQVLELGYPVLEFSRYDRVPVTPDWGVPRRAGRRARRAEAARVAASGRPVPEDLLHDGEDLEYVAVRERLEFLNEVSGRIGTSLDLAQTIIEVSRAVVPRFTDVAGTYLREQVVAGEGFAEGVPDTITMDAAEKSEAETLHAELGDTNVYMRGVLHQCEPDDRQSLVDGIATLVGERGRLFLVELAEAAGHVLKGLARSAEGPPAKLAAVFRHGIAPGEVADAAVPEYLRSAGLDVLASGDLPLLTTERSADGTRTELPSKWIVAGRQA